MADEWDNDAALGRPGEAMLALGQPEFFTDGSKLVRIPVRVTAQGLVVETWIELEAWGEWIQGLIAYLDDLDASWRGWSGVKEWSDDQRNITLSATHDSTLVATLTVSVKHLPEGADGTGAWDTKVVVPFEPAAISRAAKWARVELGRAPWEVPALPQKG